MGKVYGLIALFKGSGHPRSILAVRGAFYSMIFKGLAVIVNILYVPLLIDCLNTEKYGIWLTLSSIINWIVIFDFGLGNGLRNKLTESLARNELTRAREYVSTSYFLFAIICLTLTGLFLVVNPFLNWNSILNTFAITNNELKVSAGILFVFFAARLILMNVTIIAYAKQLPWVSNAIAFATSLFTLFSILMLVKMKVTDFKLLVFVLSSVGVFILLISSVYLFNRSFSDLRPSVKFINLSRSNEILSLGFDFFIIQLAFLVIFTTSNLIITQTCGPDEVTVYNLVYTYFSVSTIIYSIILTPIWSAVTDAYYKKDFQWLARVISNLRWASLLFIGTTVFMLIVSRYAFYLWLHNRVVIPFVYSFFMTLTTIVIIFIAPYSQFINGVGKLKIMKRLTLFNLLIYIPLAIFLSGTVLKAAGIMLATLLINSFAGIFQVIQVNRIVNMKATGVWDE